jgi:hypothetical protein
MKKLITIYLLLATAVTANAQQLKSFIENEKTGFMDKWSKVVVIQPIFDKDVYAGFCKGGYAKVAKNSKVGYINIKGTVIIDFKYDYGTDIYDGFAFVSLNAKYALINMQGEVITPFKYEHIQGSVTDFLGAVQLGGKWGFIDTNGKEIIVPQYEECYAFSDGLATVKKNGKWGCIDKTGKVIIPIKYDYCILFGEDENSTRVELGGKFGVIDKAGKEVIPIKYEDVQGYGEGEKYVKFNGKWGVVDTNGKVIMPFEYKTFREIYDASE